MPHEHWRKIIKNDIMFTFPIYIVPYPIGVYNVQLGPAVQANGDVADGTLLDHMGRALATGNGCGWWRGKRWGC